MAGYDWKSIIQPLNETESEHLTRILSDPVVVKYFKNVAYESMIDQAMMQVDTLIELDNDTDFRIMAAYHKGKLEVAESLLSYLDNVHKQRPPS